MNPNSSPDFIPDDQMPEFIPDKQADSFFKSSKPASGKGAIGTASNVMRTIGMGAIPDIAGAATAIPGEFKDALNVLTAKDKNAAGHQAIINGRESLNNNPFFPDNTGTKTYPNDNPTVADMKNGYGSLAHARFGDDPTAGMFGESLSTVAGVDGAKSLLSGVAALKGKLTQNGINAAMKVAKDKSVASGVTKSWKDVVTEAEQKLKSGDNQFRPDLAKEVRRILSSKTPAPTTFGEDNQVASRVLEKAPTIAGKAGKTTKYVLNKKTGNLNKVGGGSAIMVPKGATATGVKTVTKMGGKAEAQESVLNAHDLHDFRVALDKSIPKNAWANPNTRNIGVEANQFVRKIVSDSLHEIAPETKTLDKINSRYYSPAFQKLGVGKYSVNAPQKLKGAPTATINAVLGALIGDKSLKKLTGIGL